jgi:formiminoglutamase
MTGWTGRTDPADGPDALRWHQKARPLEPGAPHGIALIGFACDEGVRRNGGRVGAKEGPASIRKALANLAWHQRLPVYDVGDVRCDDQRLEDAQARLGVAVAEALAAGHRALVLGGGHEAAWGTFQGVTAAFPGAEVGIVNIDAHLDLRGDEVATSGTPFRQAADWCLANGRRFHYLCLGMSYASNTAGLLRRSRALGARWLPDRSLDEAEAEVESLARLCDVVHLSIDLDVLPASVLPGVSAPAGRGVPLEVVERLIALVLRTGKVAAVDVVELAPGLDPVGWSARVAASVVWQVAADWDGGSNDTE